VKQALIAQVFAPLMTTTLDMRPIIPCQNPWNYRNKMEFTFSQNRAGERFLGLMMAGAKGKVINLSACHLSPQWFIPLLEHVRVWWAESGLSAYRMNDTGSLRTLTVREGLRTGDKLVMLTVSGNPDYALTTLQIQTFQKAIQAALPNEPRLSIFLRIHQIQKGQPTQFFEMHLAGPDHMLERLQVNTGSKQSTLNFKISPTSFFQPNTAQAEILYSQALQLVSFPKRHVLDLYAGTATLGMALALEAEAVTAIELNPHAVFDAESNKELNQVHGLKLLCGDVGQTLVKLQLEEGFVPPDLVILDPPRTGLDAQALSHLIHLNVPEILYISCNPATQALNIQELVNAGYELVIVQPVDQFPHTVHIENIALLKKKN
jgi:23S rRNA (uracil1939-C5)-methyltransferase